MKGFETLYITWLQGLELELGLKEFGGTISDKRHPHMFPWCTAARVKVRVMLWQMTSDVPLTQCYQGWTEQSAAPVYLCFWRKGVAPAAESGSADSQEAIAHIGKLIFFFFLFNWQSTRRWNRMFPSSFWMLKKGRSLRLQGQNKKLKSVFKTQMQLFGHTVSMSSAVFKGWHTAVTRSEHF